MSRRARLQPAQAGLEPSGPRRVAGLRRAEVAGLADVSPEYYAKIERGHLAGVSDGVLDAVARALRLDTAEREHLFDLAKLANGGVDPVRRRKPTKKWAPRESLRQALDAIVTGPALVYNRRTDVLAANALGRAFFDELFEDPARSNLARFCFLDERAREFVADWDAAADITVAILRIEAGRDPRGRQLQDLVGELSTRSEDFRAKWGADHLRRRGSGSKKFHHRQVGEVTLTYEKLELALEPGLCLLIFTAPGGSSSAERLQLLASLAAAPAGPKISGRGLAS